MLTIIPETFDGELASDLTREEVVRASWCYLHGELETENGFDIFSILKKELEPQFIDSDTWLSDDFPEGIYDCICFDKPCTFFIWSNGRRNSGLVVLNSDLEAFNYAKKSFEEKSSSI